MPRCFETTLVRFYLLASLAILVYSCVPPTEEAFEGIVVDLNDPTTRRIYQHQNSRNIDSLLAYVGHTNPSYRYLSTRAFGSFGKGESNVSQALATNLSDRYELIRSAAAYSIGQIGEAGDVPSLTMAFDTLGKMGEFNATLLAAVGKIGEEATLRQVTDVVTYRPQDTLLRAGQLWSLLYFAHRGERSAEGDSLVLDRLLDPATPSAILEPAAYYLQRFPVAVNSEREVALRERLRTEQDANVLMGLVKTVGTTGTSAAQVALVRSLENNLDWRVRVEILKALGSFEYALVRPAVLQALSDSHPLVRRQAATFLLENGQATDAAYYHRFAKDSTRIDIRYLLYGAANRHLPLYLTDYRGRINYDLQQAFAATEDVYDKAEILLSLAEFPWNYSTIHDLYLEAASPVVRTAAAEALYRISKKEDFRTFFRASANRVRLDLAGYFQAMITNLSVGPAFHAANAIAEDPDEYRPLFANQVWLRSALRAFKLPKEVEAYYAVDAARASLAGEPAPKPAQPNTGARSIDWDILGEGGQDVQIRTTAGRFTLRMLPDIAPATVTNFLKLAGEGYYDGKVFHRVVPNFVAQGGGPLGDGFGAEDFIVRTETPGIRWNRPGLVGMASAGRDTEGVQFFITHRATPHLDGKYTIFAEVTEGQEAVDLITVGTKIESILIR